ncbi:MAG: amino acid aminotransferase [Acidobacteria bacterium]|nr:MAG: amino acid aminotransferase [Acidobacteriota bacterium]
MPEIANINGRICAIHEAVVPAEDRGYLFGDGVYEVLRSYNGRMWAFERHRLRFERSLQEIAIQNLNLEQVFHWVVETYEHSRIPEATVYFHVTRGVAPRSHAWSEDIIPTFFMTVRPFVARGEGNEHGIKVISVLDQRWGRCDIKSLNLLPNVLAKQKARSQGAYEALLVDEKGQVREGTSSAVVCILQGTLCAPPNSCALLPSITRQFVFEIADDLKIPIRQRSFSLTDLYGADEAFIAGSGDEIMGITDVDGKPLGNGKPGELTQNIYQQYRNRIAQNEDQPANKELL